VVVKAVLLATKRLVEAVALPVTLVTAGAAAATFITPIREQAAAVQAALVVFRE
jgi:hypothetical protein